MRGGVGVSVDVYLDLATSGRVMAHVLEPPGLGTRFTSRAEMEHHLPREIRDHFGWLALHRESMPAAAVPVVRIVEEVRILGDFQSGDDVGFYRGVAAGG